MDIDNVKTIYGIDFSGAVDAGKKIWIAKGVILRRNLHIIECYSANELPGSSNDRDQCLKSVCKFIRDAGPSVFGMDFAFGLPARLVKDKSWKGFAERFATKYTTHDDFRMKCRACENGTELKRVTDIDTKTPFSPYNLRMYRQTYFGIRYILSPLIRNREVSVLPMMKPQIDKPSILEVCPASTLKKAGLYVPYKGNTSKHLTARSQILERAAKDIDTNINLDRVKSITLADPNGDAIDSTLAAIASFQAMMKPESLTTKDKVRMIEGYVYV